MSSRLLLVSGLSGSGKSVALHALEDLGYYCVDNLPAGLLPALSEQVGAKPERYKHLAVGIDARAGLEEVTRLPELLEALAERASLIFLTADDPVLIRRFSETRRRHPLAGDTSLAQAIKEERELLAELENRADHVIDTSETNIHQLRRAIWNLISRPGPAEITTLVLESFAYKHGVPRDVDLVFDARCLPNPHWQPGLREGTGLEQPVRDFLESDTRVEQFGGEVLGFLQRWLPAWAGDQRSHLTVGIGCTGGRHRSVYLVDVLARKMRRDGLKVITHHRELEK